MAVDVLSESFCGFTVASAAVDGLKHRDVRLLGAEGVEEHILSIGGRTASPTTALNLRHLLADRAQPLVKHRCIRATKRL